jgi:hypothetical protein
MYVVVLIVESIRTCGEEGERIKDCLYFVGQNYEGVSGVITFDEYGDVNKPVELFEIKNMVGVPLNR